MHTTSLSVIKSAREKSCTRQNKHLHGSGTWLLLTAAEPSTYLAQQLNAMQTDVAELQNALQGSALRYADLMVQRFTSEPRVSMVIEAGDEATAVMSRLQALETRSTGAMTTVPQRFRGKEATEYKPQTWSGEKGSES